MGDLTETPAPEIGRWLRNLLLSSAALWIGYQYFQFAAIETARADYGSGAAITPICLFWVLLATLARPLTRRCPPWLRIETQDVLFIFLFLLISGPLLLSVVTFVKGATAIYYEGSRNEMTKTLLDVGLPRLVPSDEAILSMYRGSPDRAIDWKAWITASGAWVSPALAWGIYVLFFLGMCFGWTLVFSKRWLDDEQLAFPMARVGELLVDGYKTPTSPTRLPLFATGFFGIGLAATFLFQIATYLSPGLEHRLGSFYIPDTTPLFGVLDYASRQFWWRPVFLGMLILCPRQILGSALFFNVALAFFTIIGANLGYKGYTGSDLPGATVFPFKQDQLIGGAIALTLIMLWLARHDLAAQARALGSFLGRRRDGPGAGRSPGGLILLTVSMAGFVLWSLSIGFAMRTVLFFLFCLSLGAVVNTRGRAESGMPLIVVFSSFNPLTLVSILGTQLLGVTTLAASALHGWLFWNNVGQITPSLMDAMKLSRIMRRPIRWAIGVAGAAVIAGLALAVITVFSSMYTHGIQHWAYKWGSGTPELHQAFQWMKRQTGVSGVHSLYAVAGGVIVTFLWLGRTWFPGFALHPMGYLLSLHSGLHHFSLSLIIAYVVNTLLIHYGGMKAYVRVVPLFTGLLCGQILGALVGGLLNVLMGTSVYIPSE